MSTLTPPSMMHSGKTRVFPRTGGMMNLPTPDFDRAPLLVLWEVTRACELACSHCRAAAAPNRDPLELTTEESRRLLRDIKEMGTPLVVLTGGDPLLRSDLPELIAYGTSLGLRMTLTPSVTPRLTPSALQELYDAGLRHVAFSLDSADAEVHDSMRGVKGTFARTVDLVEQARSLGLSVQINTTVTRTTLASLDRMPPLLERLGVSLWSVFFLVPVGRGALAEVPDAPMQEEAFAILYRAAERGSFAVKATEAPHYRRFALRKKGDRGILPRPGINDGKGVAFIDHRGNVFPSGFLPISAGNVRKKAIATIYREEKLFRTLRNADALGGKCGVCEYRKICGGSRARSFAMTGDFMAAEPCCAYVPERWQEQADR